MKFEMEHIGKIHSSSIELDGITLIAGDNSSGKTTIAKALYGALSPLSNFYERVMNSRLDSIGKFAGDWFSNVIVVHTIGERSAGLVTNRRFRQSFINLMSHNNESFNNNFRFTEEYLRTFVQKNFSNYKNTDFITSDETSRAIRAMNEAWQRSDEAYASMIFAQELNNQFRSQIKTFDYSGVSKLCIDNFSIQISDKGIEEIVLPEPIGILQGGSVVYFAALREFSNETPFTANTNLPELIKKSSLLDSPDLVYEEFIANKEIIQEFRGIIEDIIRGHFKETDIGLQFVENDYPNKQIAMENTASGILPFAIIDRLIENGTLSRNSVLIIDEPEMNLHPEWQIAFGKLLVSLAKKLDIKSLLISHSPYFIRAIEKTLSQNNSVKSAFYLMSPKDMLYTAENVTDKVGQIYEHLYKPLEEL
ncbi:MAG: ATP-binding protein [Sphaerochaeta sp.]|nr:ATP-binding protein [Sphaerochaeta sp.]